MSRAYVWTLNNYTPEQVAKLRTSVGKAGIKYIGWGYEVAPTTGTPHLQGYMQSTEKTKERIFKATGLYVELARGTYGDNTNYITKDGEHEEYGTANKQHMGHGGQGQRSDLNGVKKAIEEGKSYEEICDEHFGEAAKFNRFIREQVELRNTKKARASLHEELSALCLHQWELDLLAVVDADPDPRKIHWIYETTGNAGKSTFANWLAVNRDACILELGKRADLAYIYSQDPKRVVIFDLPRTLMEKDKMDHLYNLAEQLKNCRLTTTKYESKTIYFPCPHVIFFANFPPDLTKWSGDRYVIKVI